MKKFKIIMACALVAIISFAGCGNSESSEATQENGGTETVTDNGPKSTYTKFMKYVLKEDFETAVDMLYEADKASAEEKALVVGLLKEFLAQKGGIKDFEILSEQITNDGAKAKLKVKYTYGDGSTKETTENLVKTDDGWACKL